MREEFAYLSVAWTVQKEQSSGQNAERQGCYSEGPGQAEEMG